MKTISSRQAGIIVFLMIISLKLLYLPGFICNIAKSDAFIVVLLGLAIDFFFFLFILFLMNKNKGKSLYEIIESKVGKWLNCVFFFILAIYFLAKMLLAMFETYAFFSEILFDELNWIDFIIPIAVMLLYMQTKNLRTFGRCCEVLLPFILIGILLVIFIPIKSVDLINLLPIFSNGSEPILNGIFKTSFAFIDAPILFILMGNIKIDKHFNIKLIMSYILGALLILIYCVVFQSIFGIVGNGQGLALSDIPFHQTFPSGVGRLDWLLIILWTFDLVFFITLMGYIVIFCLNNIAKLKSTMPYSIGLTIVAILLLICFNLNLRSYLDVITSIPFLIFALGVGIFLPLILSIVLLFKNKNQDIAKFSLNAGGGKNVKTIKKNLDK